MNRFRVAANTATLANAALGVAAVVYALAGNTLWGILLLVGALGFDGLDGYLARKAPARAGLFGRVADSVADSISFGVAPATFVAAHMYDAPAWAPLGAWPLAVAGLVLTLAIGRLVYFTLRGFAHPHFVGASTPQTTLAISLLILWLVDPGFLGKFPVVFLLLVALLAPLMVLPIGFPKMRRGELPWFRWTMAATAASLAVAVIAVQFHPASGSLLDALAVTATAISTVGIAFYYIAGPIALRRMGSVAQLGGTKVA